jgi:hypothetical protein
MDAWGGGSTPPPPPGGPAKNTPAGRLGGGEGASNLQPVLHHAGCRGERERERTLLGLIFQNGGSMAAPAHGLRGELII